MTNQLKNVRVAFLVANEGIEQSELSEPWKAVVDAGGRPELVAPKPGLAGTMRHLEQSGRFPVDRVTEEVTATDFDAVVLPGGVANPDQLRQDAPAVDFLMAMFEAGKPVAAICHGPWTLIEGDLVCGRTMTSWPSLQTDLRNAGATWVDREVAVCRDGINVLVTSRQPSDLKAFCREITSVFSEPPVALVPALVSS
ncbi:MAG TPA: type 1 glutamine amidotransferase domain-containing protein [Acidimicrobiales bacterium]|jgi:protease I|nr:type 1 glutamine amidotransferase domain-containing protein [Acidimicrobiales bacterium]